MGFESTTPVFEWAKTVHALDRVASVIGKVLASVFKELSSALFLTHADKPTVNGCIRITQKHKAPYNRLPKFKQAYSYNSVPDLE
jgi:hypothetical protein